jgi:nucleotidyltransferase-like protein
LRTSGRRLSRLWRFAYRRIARIAAAYLARGKGRAAVYAAGSLGTEDHLPGVSDIDLVVVVEPDPAGRDGAKQRAMRRRERLGRIQPLLGGLMDRPRIYEDDELRALAPSSTLTYGLDRRYGSHSDAVGYVGERASLDRILFLERPGLYTAIREWNKLAGPDLRSPEPARDRQSRRIAAWLELVFNWRIAFLACADPTWPRLASLCVRWVSVPAQIWLWLAHGERVPRNEEALHRALALMPEEESALRHAISLLQSLPELPAPPLAEAISTLVRLSGRIATHLVEEVAAGGATEVRLAGAGPEELVLPDGEWSPTNHAWAGRGEPHLLPLADWRGLASGGLPDESFALVPAYPGDPSVLGAAVRAARQGPFPVLRAEGLMIFAAGGPIHRSRLRAVQCQATDPVSFALAQGSSVARFPRVTGWSAEDTALRAVAEHRAWLRTPSGTREDGGPDEDGVELGRLLTAARAALFHQRLELGDPELALTVTETVRQLAALSAEGKIAEDALGHYREFALDRARPPAGIVAALRDLVLELPAYAAA